MANIVGIGANVYDTLIDCSTYPEQDKKVKANDVFVSGGGPVGNALVVMSKLGVSAEVVGAFSSDMAGKYLLEDFFNFIIYYFKAFCSFFIYVKF